MTVLVTGAAGFIGFHTAHALLKRGDHVAGFDSMSPYYDVRLKEARLAQLAPNRRFTFVRGDLADKAAVDRLFAEHRPERVIHMAAQAGVRHSLLHPEDYVQSNLVGFLNILEACRDGDVKHLVFASSSSVYGANTKVPFSVHDNVDHPVSLYAATKKSNELMAHTYAHLFRLPTTGLRFFTVYGPWGRPDMALFKFVERILADEPIDVYNEGRHARDFTYIDDVVEAVLRISERVPQPNPDWSGDAPDPSSSSAPYRLYNIGNHTPVQLLDFIGLIESALGRLAKKNFLPLQPGDIPATYADVSELISDIGFAPKTPIKKGIEKFVAWYRAYHGA
jgi:UDP-glucuronate 4-epimerase